MPLYEYQCPKCGRFELIRKFSDAALKSCPTCGREVQKLASAPAIQFKGSGWYITDYARKGAGGDGAGSGSGKDKDGAASKDKGASKDAPAAKEASAAKDSSSGTTTASSAKDSGSGGSDSTK